MTTTTAKRIEETRTVKRIEETSDRVRRMETKMHKICTHMGIDTDDAPPTKVVSNTEVIVRGHDVTLSRIRRDIQNENMFETGTDVRVRSSHTDRVIAVVNFLE